MFIKKIYTSILSSIFIIGMLCGCEKTASSANSTGTSESVYLGNDTNASDMFTERDFDASYDEEESTHIQLNGDSIVCDSSSVQISKTTITITDDGTYIFSGTLNDGMIIVNAGETDKPQLVFNGASIHSETSAALYILEADKVFITFAEGTSNTFSNGGTFTAIDENHIDAAIFSKQDLTLNGSGNLTITSPMGHGIVSKDDLVITSGTYTINSASHGLDANDSVRIVNATFTIHSGKDGMHAENAEEAALGFVYIKSGTFQIFAEGDGISAGSYMQIEGGNFDIVSGGGSVNAQNQSSASWGGFQDGGVFGDVRQRQPSVDTVIDTDDSTSIKALKSSGNLLIKDGVFVLDAADDAIHSNATITINGGDFEIYSGDDGIHANELLAVTSATIHIIESYEGLEGMHIEISGGEIKIAATDDGLNAAGGTDESGYGGQRKNDRFANASSSDGSIIISGGDIYIRAYGDGIDANGTLEISGGTTMVCGPTQGDTSVLDYDASATITGGTFIGTGSSQMAQTFSSSQQGVISVNVKDQSSGTAITLKDSGGNTILSHEPEQSFNIVILSSPDIVKGETYTVIVGSSLKELIAE